MNINRDYLIINDVKKSSITLNNGSMFFYITDKNTQNIFVNLVINVSDNELIQRYANIENAEDYTLTMNIVKPDNDCKIIEGRLCDKEKAIFEFNLEEDCVDKIGTYKCELLTKCNINGHEEITTSNSLTYTVNSSILNDLDGIVEAPEYPAVIQLFDRLSDIDQYEEDRRANEVARQLAEQQRQARIDTLIVDTKADIDDYKVAKDQEIDAAINTQNDRITAVENRLDNIGSTGGSGDSSINTIINEHTSRLDAIEAINTTQNTRLNDIEAKNQQQDDRLLAIERVNERQDADLEILLGEPSNDMTEITKRGNSIYLQNSVVGHCEIDNIQGNTLVNCNKEPNKQLILNGDINTSAVSSVTLTEGVNGGKVDVALEGNTLVNVSKTKDSTAITKSYTVENSGNHIALQGDVNGSCRPVITGNTLWIDNATGKVLTEFDEAKNLRLQSTFEDNLVTQEMIDSGGEIADNLDKYRVDYRVTGKNKFDKSKTLDEYAISQGKIVQQPNWFVTDFIPVIPNTSYSISGKSNGSGVIYYDNNKQTLRTSVGGTSLITVPNGAKYVRLNGTLIQKDTFQLEEGNTTTEYEPYKRHIKTLYLNSPLLEGDTIEEKNGGIYHVHRSELVAYTEGDEASLITDRVHTLHQLASPRYELIEQSNLVIPSYVKGHLDFNTAVPVEKVEFKPFIEELTYLYANTQYTVQFVSDKATTADITLGGTSLLAQSIAEGLNRISITTPSELVDNKLIINGNGTNIANISEVVVTDTDREFMYFEGMKSVGECEELEVVVENCYNYFDENDVTIEGADYISNIFVETNEGEKWTALSSNDGWLKFRIYNQDKELVGDLGNIQSNKLTITIPAGVKYIKAVFSSLAFAKPMVVKGDKVLPYEDYIPHQSNAQQLTHEPLRAVGDAKDRYVLIDGKWYIERNCREMIFDGSDDEKYDSHIYEGWVNIIVDNLYKGKVTSVVCDKYICDPENSHNRRFNNTIGGVYEKYSDGTESQWIRIVTCDFSNLSNFKQYLQSNPVTVVYKLQTPYYEEIDYNPLEVYSGTTHITTNSVIPCNLTVKNHGFNCLLKPSTTYTISSNLGLNTVTTPSALTEDCLRFMDTDTSDVTTMKNVLVLEGDWTTKADVIPSNFSGIESAFEQELVTDIEDAHYGKYKVNVKIANENNSAENNMVLYINEPLRGIGSVKDKIYVKDNKVVVERKCGARAYQDGDFGTHPTDKVNTVYPLAEPVYEEVQYNGVKLSIETFNNSTLSYNSNVAVTSTVRYSYSVPLVDTVAQTADISDQQDQLIINLATEVAILEMMTL